jgi:hypothetical protein
MAEYTGLKLNEVNLAAWKEEMTTYIPGELVNEEIANLQVSLGEPIVASTSMIDTVVIDALTPLTFTSNLVSAIMDSLIPLYSYISIKWRTIFRKNNSDYEPIEICLNNDLRNVTPKQYLPYKREVLDLFEFTATEQFREKFFANYSGAQNWDGYMRITPSYGNWNIPSSGSGMMPLVITYQTWPEQVLFFQIVYTPTVTGEKIDISINNDYTQIVPWTTMDSGTDIPIPNIQVANGFTIYFRTAGGAHVTGINFDTKTAWED